MRVVVALDVNVQLIGTSIEGDWLQFSLFADGDKIRLGAEDLSSFLKRLREYDQDGSKVLYHQTFFELHRSLYILRESASISRILVQDDTAKTVFERTIAVLDSQRAEK